MTCAEQMYVTHVSTTHVPQLYFNTCNTGVEHALLLHM